MPADIERMLRESLEARAQDVEPDAETWNRVQSRIRRQRTFRLALAGVSATAAVLVAIVVVPGLIDRPDVVFPGPAAPTDPDPVPGPADGCTSPADVAAVYSSQGDLWKACVGGGAHLLYGSSDIDENPAVSPDGIHVLFTSWRDSAPVIAHVYLSTGASTVLGGGELPAFAPDGRVAWVQQADGDRAFIVGGQLFSEPEFEIPVDGRVRRLAWDTVDDHLLYETGEGAVWVARPESGELLRIDDPERTYSSPAVAPDGTIAVIAVDEGGSYELGYLDRAVLAGAEPGYRPVVDLPMLDDFSEPFLAPAGYVWAEQVGDMEHRWVPRDELAWLVGSPGWVSLLREDGERVGLAMEAEMLAPAMNPAAVLGEREGDEPLYLEPQAVPHNVEVTRQRIHAAARAGDFGGLHALMVEEFSWSFGGNLDRDEAIAYLRDNPELLDVIAGLLELPYGVVDPVEPEYFVWPWVFTDPEANWPELRDRLVAAVGEQQVGDYEEHGEYLGWRVGIDRDGVWRYFIAGD
jgi:hypothetical protein